MSKVVDIREADDARDVIHRAVQLLADGALVALPTETGYVLAAQALQTGPTRGDVAEIIALDRKSSATRS